MADEFIGRVIAITGAGKGLGRADALYLAGLGASVVVNNRRHEGERQSSADRTVQEITASGGEAVAEYSSVEDADAGGRLLAVALENFGRLDGLIANAGIMEGVTFHKQTLEQFRQVIEINLFGTVNVLHTVFRHMYRKSAGNIVVSTSSAGLFGQFGLPAYSTSKAALLGFMQSLSQEGRTKGVRVNALAPYATTAMTKNHLTEEVGRRMDARAVAPAAAFLVSRGCRANGEIFICGAGRLAHARMQSTASIAVPDIDSDDWQTLQTDLHDLAFDNAIQHFEAFARDG